VASGVVYLGSPDNHAYALNAATGALLWNSDLGGSRDLFDTSPAVANGVVYLSTRSGLNALNAGTGALLWNSDLGGGVNVFGSSPAVANGVVYVAAEDVPKLGASVWAFSLPSGGPTTIPPTSGPSHSHSRSPTATPTSVPPSSGPPLANTGASVSGQWQLAVGLLILGLVAVAAANPRLRRGRHQ
jgi:hypothetical protein